MKTNDNSPLANAAGAAHAPDRKPRFPIGTPFMSRGKNQKACTVVDIWTTRNARGEVVQIRYVAQHIFAGQVVTDRDVCETTIAMGLIKK